MSILQEIQKWSQGQPAWQQDAISRLYAKNELTAEDFDDLYALLKAEHKIPDPKERVPSKLAPEHVAVSPSPDKLVQLLAIKNLRNVNALAEGQRLLVSPTGLTVIYGENGAGKSGYSRVLKKACRARDQREPILPDARKEPGNVSRAQAVFELLVDGNPVEVEWTDGKEAPEQLSTIAIFDSHCARAYIDNQGDFAYSPYGLDILEGLVTVCSKLRTMAIAEQQVTKPNIEPFNALAKTQTAVGKLLASLSAKTTPEDVEALAAFTEADQEKLATLNKTLAEADPKQKAVVLNLRAGRFSKLATRIGEAIALVNDEHVIKLRELVDASNVAKKTAELAAKNFKETPGLLPGTGGETWQKLFEAARTFAAESHPHKEFPNLGPDASCPLCQQPLGVEASTRLEAFDAFIQAEAERNYRTARTTAATAYKDIKEGNLDLGLDDTLVAELVGTRQDLADSCANMQTALKTRCNEILVAAAPGGNWAAISALPTDPRQALKEITAKLVAEAEALEKADDEKAKAAMVSEQAELEAKRQLSELKATALDAVSRFHLLAKLKACEDATAAGGISRKSTELSKTMATVELANALNAELNSLNVHELHVAMKPVSPKGKTQFKLVLELPGGIAPKDILSEGEQRAIAIASFMAEVKMGSGRGGIVFDDPVSSLDHRRRWHVAKRLVEEAAHRQVIIFTHDIYFLCILQQEASDAGLDFAPQCIRKTAKGFGAQTGRLPFDAMSTSKRVGALRQMQAEVSKAHNVGDEEEATRLMRDAYYHLRLAWERAVEEVLLQGVVTRFNEGISTQKLSYVTVEDADFKAVEAGMTKSSKFAHDPAAAAHLPTPHPDELVNDIEALEVWRKQIESRKNAIRDRRL